MAIEHKKLCDSTLVDLGDGLALRTASTMADVERIAAFNEMVHSDEEIAKYTRWKLAGGHPNICLSDAVLVEDMATGEVVSSLCSFPQTWSYEGIPLPVREIALVGTDPRYRKRGLIRAQMRHIHSEMRAEGSLLGCIAGIPGFYRQFGYEYAVPLGSCARLSMEKLPVTSESSTGSLRVRPIDLGRDLPAVMSLYRQSASQLQVLADRSQALWQYLEAAPAGVPDRQETWVIESGGEVAAYFRLCKNMWGPWLELAEMCIEGSLGVDERPAAYEAMLRCARRIAVDRNYLGLCVALDPHHELLRLIERLGAEPERQYAWQVKAMDEVEFLRRIAPVLERRLADSGCRDCSRILDINLMSSVARITFEQGRVTGVASQSDRARPERELRLSDHQFVQLVLGYCDYAALMDSSLDAWVHPEVRDLAGILFPRLRSFVNGAN